MKTFILFYFVCVVLGQEVEDLGLITPKKVILLEHANGDSLLFKVKLNWSTNSISFTTSNPILRMQDYNIVPSGLVLLEFSSIRSDGEVSDTAIYRFRYTTNQPPKPRAKTGFASNVPPLPGGTNKVYGERKERP